MVEIYRTNDLVLISWLVALLKGDGIETFVMDTHFSVLEGSIGAIPRRIMVAGEHQNRARATLRAADIEPVDLSDS
jgi:hypothetical protein